MTDSPRSLRDEIADDYRRNAQRMGAEVSFADAQRMAQMDLELVDAHDRVTPVQPATGKERVIEDPEERAEAERQKQEASIRSQLMAGEVGGRVEKRAAVDAPAIETLGSVNIEKRLKLLRRVGQICSRDRTGEQKHPKLARLVQATHANWTFGVREYALARSQVDRDRIFFRKLEDICDRSNAVLGPWWVK